MAEAGILPSYDCVGDSEIDGDENRFTVRVLISGEVWGEGTSRTKRLAERQAAQAALKRIDQRAASVAEVAEKKS